MSTAPIEQPEQPTPAAAIPTETGQRQEQTIPYARFKEVNDQLAELKRKDADREAKEQAEAAKRAKELGQWEQVAKTAEGQLEALKPKADNADRYAQRLHARIDAEIKDWPKQAKDLVPDTTTDPDARETQVEKLRSLVEMLQTNRSPGTSPGPRGSGAGTQAGGPSMEDMKNEKRARIGGL